MRPQDAKILVCWRGKYMACHTRIEFVRQCEEEVGGRMDFYAAPGRVKSLVVPCGHLQREDLDGYTKRLQKSAHVWLEDVREDPVPERAHFSPKGYPNGRILYDFSKQVVPQVEEPLFDLDPWRQQLLVVGAASDNGLPASERSEALQKLRKKYPRSLCHVILIFETPGDAPRSSEIPNVFEIRKSNFTGLELALANVTAEFLAQLSLYSITRCMGLFESPDEKQISVNHRHRARPSVGRNGSISMNNADQIKSKQSARTSKFIGSLFLMAGRLPDAINHLSASAESLSEFNDSLWIGSALELIGVCFVLLFFSEAPLPAIPNIVLTIMGDTKQKGAAQKPLEEFLPLLTRTVLELHKKSNDVKIKELEANRSEVDITATQRPKIASEEISFIYHDMTLRYATLMTFIRLGGGWTHTALSAAILGRPIQNPTITSNSPTIREIDYWVESALGLHLRGLSLLNQVHVLVRAASIYACLGLRRKWAFAAEQLIAKIAAGAPGIPSVSLIELLTGIYGNWTTLNATTLRNCVALAGRIGNEALQLKLAAQLLTSAYRVLDAKEQMALHQLIKAKEDANPHPYWDPNILRGIDVETQQITHAPKQQKKHFMYNPFERLDTKEAIEAGIPATAQVTLRNPFAFDVHVYALAILSGEKRVGPEVRDVMLPAESLVVVDVQVVGDEGNLTITGCYIQISGCRGSEYSLPEAINIEVSPSRPILVLEYLSISKGWAMLLEGERIPFTVKLHNSSDTPSNILQFGFTDSTVEPLRQAASRSDTPRAELYEYEYFLYKRHAVELISQIEEIPPHKTAQFEFVMMGKRGVASATILVDHGVSKNALRRLRIPLQLSVYSSIELDRVDFVPDPRGIIVILDLRNSWRDMLEVTLWTELETTTHMIPSLSVQRFLVLMPWQYLSQEQLSRPIPRLGSKQFVLDRATGAESTQIFWLREQLLSQLDCNWKTLDGSRRGSVELRGIQLSRKMADILRSDPLDICLKAPSTFKVDSVVTISVELSNKTSKLARGMLRLVPDTDEHFLYIGTLQSPISVPAHSSTVFKVDVIYLCAGKFEWTSVLDVIGGGQVFQMDKTPMEVFC